jgi:hypothetical protein
MSLLTLAFCNSVPAPVENVERRKQLAAEERRSPRIPGQRRQRRHRRPRATEPAEIRFHPPDADNDWRRHTIAARHLIEQRAVFRVRIASRAHELRCQATGDVGLEGEDRLGLGPVAFDDNRQRLLNVVQGRVDDLLPDAPLDGFGANAVGIPRRRREACADVASRRGITSAAQRRRRASGRQGAWRNTQNPEIWDVENS